MREPGLPPLAGQPGEKAIGEERGHAVLGPEGRRSAEAAPVDLGIAQPAVAALGQLVEIGLSASGRRSSTR